MEQPLILEQHLVNVVNNIVWHCQFVTPDCGLIQEQPCPNHIVSSCFQQPVTTCNFGRSVAQLGDLVSCLV